MGGHQAIGQRAEGWALTHLEEHGLRLVARNWRCRYGELDLVMLDENTLIFVEVRYRAYQQWGGAEASIDSRKCQRITTAAQLFLQEHSQWADWACRFDAVAISPSTLGVAPQLNWIRGAFCSCS